MLRRLYCCPFAQIAADGGSMKKPLIDSEHFPETVGEMKIRVSRRGMFSAAADAAAERKRSRAGLPSYRIEDLTEFDVAQFSELYPAVNRKAKISLEKGIVCAETSAAVDPIPLFPLDSPALVVFNQFNGEQPMSEVFVKVQQYTGWDEEKTRSFVRAVFLKLCEVRVCEPGCPE